jgi:hypothetical protein
MNEPALSREKAAFDKQLAVRMQAVDDDADCFGPRGYSMRRCYCFGGKKNQFELAAGPGPRDR